MKYLLDTNTCIYLIKRKPAQVIRKMMKMKTDNVKEFMRIEGLMIENWVEGE